MRKGKWLSGACGFIGLFCLIMDSRTAIEGSVAGIHLCIQTLVPSLFPFFLFSALIQNACYGNQFPVLYPLGRLFRMPRGTEALLIPAFLGGYPVGAVSIRDAYDHHQISRQDAERMLAYCNNCGPSFLFGVIGPMFSELKHVWVLWGIHIFSSCITANILPCPDVPSETPDSCRKTTGDSMVKALRAMALVCGWVILFRVILAFLYRWVFWLCPAPVQVLFTGLLELSNGCCLLRNIDNWELRFFISAILLSLGGLCVTMQSISAVKGLSMGLYAWGKVLHGVFSMMLSILYLRGNGLWVMAAVAAFAIYLEFRKKYSGNPRKAIV